MTDIEMLEKFEVVTGESDSDVSEYYLNSAKSVIINYAYPFDDDVDSIPAKWHQTQLDIAIYLWGKNGAEGELAHSENGVSRTYESGDVPQSMLRRITPKAGLL